MTFIWGQSTFQSIFFKKLLSIRENQLNPIKEQLYMQIDRKKADEAFMCIAQHFDYVAVQKQISDYKGEPSTISEFERFKYRLALYGGNIDYILEHKSSKKIQKI